MTNSKSPLTFCITTHNELQYLINCVDSVRKNSFYKEAPFIIHAENCTDGTTEWLNENKEKYNLDIYIDTNLSSNQDKYLMDFFTETVETEFIMFLYARYTVNENWDLNCINTLKDNDINKRMWVSPYKISINENAPVFDAHNTNMIDNLNGDYSLSSSDLSVGLIRKQDWDYIGGADSIFKSIKYKNNDIQLRMLQQKYTFVVTEGSVMYDYSNIRFDEFEVDDECNWIKKWGVCAEYNKYGCIINNITNEFLDIPIVITNRDRYFPLIKQIKKLKHLGYYNIIVIDNKSTYEPLVNWYLKNLYSIDLFYNNVVPNSHLSFKFLIDINHPKFLNIFKGWYIGTDSDVVLEESTPHNFVNTMYQIAIKYNVSKVGSAISLDNFNLSHPLNKKTYELESQYWSDSYLDSEFNIMLYPHPIDTTFALHAPETYPVHSHHHIKENPSIIQKNGSIRLGSPIMIEHIPFSYDLENLPSDEIHYIRNMNKNSSCFSGKINIDANKY